MFTLVGQALPGVKWWLAKGFYGGTAVLGA
jgi:hypothetical protein